MINEKLLSKSVTTTPALLTRRDAVRVIRETYGIPITLSAFQIGSRKICPALPCPKAPPKHALKFGTRHLYRAEDIHEWAGRLNAAFAVK